MLTHRETQVSMPLNRRHHLDRHRSWAQGLPSCSTTLLWSKRANDPGGSDLSAERQLPAAMMGQRNLGKKGRVMERGADGTDPDPSKSRMDLCSRWSMVV